MTWRLRSRHAVGLLVFTAKLPLAGSPVMRRVSVANGHLTFIRIANQADNRRLLADAERSARAEH